MTQKLLPEIIPGDIIGTLRNCGGAYECPMNADGKPLGPLVGYAGQYEGADGRLFNYVGHVYYNLAKGDQWFHVAHHWARSHAKSLAKFSPDLLVAAPMGGISYMSVLKQSLSCRGIFAEKKTIIPAQEGRREQSALILGRYDICSGDRVVLIEDITNNFSTTEQLIKLVEAHGGKVMAIACVINRSDKTTYWNGPERDPLPVVSLQQKSTPQYRQDDPVVAEYIKAGNVVMKPKDQWERLVEAEAAHV